MKDLTADELRTSWPDARLSNLLDSAQRHLLDRQPEQAVAVWQQLIRAGGGDADWGHLEYADYLLREGRDGEARSELGELMAAGRVFSQPWRLAAELLEDREQLLDALLWYTAATDCLTAEQLRYPSGPVWARDVRAGLRRLKWKLRIPLDDTDLLAAVGDAEADQKWLELLNIIAMPEVVEGRLQFLARSGEESPAGTPIGESAAPMAKSYFRRIEGSLQAHGTRTTLLPRTLESFQPLLGVALGARHLMDLPFVLSQYDEGRALEWPPGRNQACWCESGAKYKRCCGANAAAA